MRRYCAPLRAPVSALLACTAGLAVAAGSDPPVPPSRDPGGIPVAFIGSGIDYTPDRISGRLARDGEGEIVGYDYIDDDRLPFAKADPASQDMADILLGEGQTTSLVLLRTDTEAMIPLSRALLYAGKSPARIVIIERLPRDREAILALASAMRYFHDRLFILPAGDEGRDLDQDWASRLRGIPNLLIVAAAETSGALLPGSNAGALTIDLATTPSPLKGEETRPADPAGPSMRSAAHIGAMAVRLKAVEPGIPATAIKVKIAGLAKAVQHRYSMKTINGVIEQPQRYFWLE